jgi:FlaG/FlaF family flagellin (archaellin)
MRFNMDNSGISTVIGLILIVGLIVSVAAVIKLTYIPDVKKQLEADHMQHVIDDIGQFKTQLDIAQVASISTGAGYSATAYVEMGGGAIPVVDTSASSGTLSLDPAYGTFRIDAYDIHGNALSLSDATALGRLVYQSNNHFYADQNVSYEGGMIVLAQPGGSVMLAPPSFVVAADPHVPEHPLVSVNAFRLNGTPQTFSSAGRGAIRTWLIPSSSALTSVNVTNVHSR